MKQNRNKELLPFRAIKKLTKRIVDLEDRIEFLEKVLEVVLKQKKEQATMHLPHRVIETHKMRKLWFIIK